MKKSIRWRLALILCSVFDRSVPLSAFYAGVGKIA